MNIRLLLVNLKSHHQLSPKIIHKIKTKFKFNKNLLRINKNQYNNFMKINHKSKIIIIVSSHLKYHNKISHSCNKVIFIFFLRLKKL